MDCPNPLTNEHCQMLTDALQYGAGTGSLIQKCKECGLPVDDQEQRHQALMDAARRIKATFFPNNP